MMINAATRYALTAAAVASLGFASVSEGHAQSACIGSAALPGQRALSAGVGFPDGGTDFNVRFDLNAVGPLAFFGAYTLTSIDDVDINAHTFAGGVGYELGALIPGETPIVGCPLVGVSFTTLSDEGITINQLTIPIGFGFGLTLPVADGMALLPYVIPQFFIGRSSISGGGLSESDTDTGFGATLGALLDFGAFFAGVDLVTTRWSELSETDSQFAIRAGIKF